MFEDPEKPAPSRPDAAQVTVGVEFGSRTVEVAGSGGPYFRCVR